MNLLVCYSFFSGDRELAEANAEWTAELGGVSEFPCLIVTTTDTHYAKVQRALAGAFKSVEVLALDNIETDVPPNRRWPICANRMFNQASIAAQARKMPLLFLEADAAPTRTPWLREINNAYIAHGLPFFGMRRETWLHRNGELTHDGEHMVGMGVYPADFREYSDMASHLSTTSTPFDIWLQGEIVYGGGAASMRPVKGCYNSPLMSHHWSTRNWRIEDGKIKLDKDKDYAICDEPDLRGPALVHGCKDTSLIKLLRAQVYGAVVQSETQRQAPVVDEVAEAYKAGQLDASKPLPDGMVINPEYVTASHVGLFVGEKMPSLDAQLAHDAGVQSILEGKSVIHGTPVFADELTQAMREGKVDQMEREAIERHVRGESLDSLSAIVARTDAEYERGESVDSLEPLVSPEVIGEQEPVSAEYLANQARAAEGMEEIHVSQEPVSDEAILIANIKADSEAGMKWKQLLAKYKLAPKKLKHYLNDV